MPFTYDRTIHFADTDAAGVVFFANYLTICHEAYEESLLASGIDLKVFFADHRIVVPIAKSEADYSRPLSCGDKLRVSMQPALLSEDSYEIRFEITRLGPPSKRAARIDRKSTRLNSSHLAISYAVFCLKKKKDLKSTRLNSSHLGISYAVFCL